MHKNADLDQFNNADVLRIVWDIFAEYARSPSAGSSSEYFMLMGEDSVCSHAFKRCKEQGFIVQNVQRWHYPPFKHIVVKVYYFALSMGLVLPSKLDQALDWNQTNGAFHFTSEGIRYFSGGFISIDDPGYLGQTLAGLQQRLHSISDGQIELLLEAQRCLKAGCYRAAMILIGESPMKMHV